MTKRFVVLFALACVVALAVPAMALANFGPHGNYVQDTDGCAGCHRAHTSVSTITWEDATATEHSALLVSTATSMYEFCLACHDATSQGAETNVQEGIYEGNLWNNTGELLNGGGFETMDTTPTTSIHMVQGTTDWGAYGGGYYGMGKTGAIGAPGTDPTTGDPVGLGKSTDIRMDCATCHDPHGSANYRILKSYVNGNYVGGYTSTFTPDGYVSSVETGWPLRGFNLHQDYSTTYQPNYTTPMYAKGYNMSTATTLTPSTAINPIKGMSGWCAGCHSTYLEPVVTVTRASDNTTYQASVTATYNAGDGGGYVRRHRHPMNVELSTYNAADKTSMIITDTTLPLAHDLNENINGEVVSRSTDWIECLTCHRAHGTSAVMTGFAGALGNTVQAFPSSSEGNSYSNLLRYNNRGVCERCHNK